MAVIWNFIVCLLIGIFLFIVVAEIARHRHHRHGATRQGLRHGRIVEVGDNAVALPLLDA
jgi:hypothetical protein